MTKNVRHQRFEGLEENKDPATVSAGYKLFFYKDIEEIVMSTDLLEKLAKLGLGFGFRKRGCYSSLYDKRG
jgi:hypothetical protein